MGKQFIYEIYIRASRAQVWQGISHGEFTRRYFYATRVESDWQPGSPVRYTYDDGRLAVDGEVVACEPETELVITWLPHYDETSKAEGHTQVRYRLDDFEGQTRLRVEHSGFAEDSALYTGIAEGWPWILSGLKSELENEVARAA